MEAIVDITDWYASLGGTFIRVFGREKPLHVLPRYATNKLIMQEMSYHLATGLSPALHKKKKAPRPTIPLQIGLNEIKRLKVAYAKAKEIVIFELDTDFNLYDPHSICKVNFMRFYSPWIDEEFHCLEENPWR